MPASAKAEEAAASRAEGFQSVPRDQPCRILVAEDNSANQEVVSLMLERLGHRVDVASDGVEAVAGFRRGIYDLVLMDCQMPQQDGLAATREIRSLEGTARRTPIIAMTAYAIQGDRERCLEAGMDDYLSKPVQFEELIDLLDKWLPATSGTAAPRDPIDRSVIDKLRQLESPKRPNLVGRLINRFLEQTPERVAAMQKALAERDWGQLGRLAHEMKTDSGNLGARTMSELCDQLQSAARAADVAQCTILVPRTTAEFDDVRPALAGVRDGQPTP